MSEVITIVAKDRMAADDEFAVQITNRPGATHRVLRRDSFDKATLSLIAASEIEGQSGRAERTSLSEKVYAIIVEFS